MNCGKALAHVVLSSDDIVREWDLPGPSAEKYKEMEWACKMILEDGKDQADPVLVFRVRSLLECCHGDEVCFRIDRDARESLVEDGSRMMMSSDDVSSGASVPRVDLGWRRAGLGGVRASRT